MIVSVRKFDDGTFEVYGWTGWEWVREGTYQTARETRRARDRLFNRLMDRLNMGVPGARHRPRFGSVR